MRLEDLVRPWRGSALRHIPDGSPFGPLDPRFAGLAADNRWNDPGQPAFHLASDRGVVVGEFGRHMREERSAAIGAETVARAIFRVEIALERAVDLREREVLAALSLEAEAPGCFLDRARARATARYLLAHTSAQGLLVPSMAFLDQPDRWNLIVYLDRIVAGEVFVAGPERVDTLILQRD